MNEKGEGEAKEDVIDKVFIRMTHSTLPSQMTENWKSPVRLSRLNFVSSGQ